MSASCLLCGGRPRTKSHFVPRAVREVLPNSGQSFSVLGRSPLRESEFVSVFTDVGFGRGPFDAQPKVLCARCNSAWMTQYEDVAGPILARMITASDAFDISEDEMHAIATWALAALMIRSTIDKSLLQLSTSMMHDFRAHGIAGIDAAVAVLSYSTTNALFSGPAVGSTYVFDPEQPHTSALAVFYFKSVVVVSGVGPWAGNVWDAVRLCKRSVAASWPWDESHASWPPPTSLIDSALFPALRIDGLSREMFVPPSIPRGTTTRALVRLPETGTPGASELEQTQAAAARAYQLLTGSREADEDSR